MEKNTSEVIKNLTKSSMEEQNVLSPELKSIMELEKLLSNHNISIDDYSDAFFAINTAHSKGIIKNPLRFYLALRNASVVLKPDDGEKRLEFYKNLVNTVDYVIAVNTKSYFSIDCDLHSYNEFLQSSIQQSKYITFETFKKAYYLFELYVLLGIKTNNFYEFMCLLNEAYVAETDEITEIIDITNMKAKLSAYIESYKKEYGKKNTR